MRPATGSHRPCTQNTPLIAADPPTRAPRARRSASRSRGPPSAPAPPARQHTHPSTTRAHCTHTAVQALDRLQVGCPCPWHRQRRKRRRPQAGPRARGAQQQHDCSAPTLSITVASRACSDDNKDPGRAFSGLSGLPKGSGCGMLLARVPLWPHGGPWSLPHAS